MKTPTKKPAPSLPAPAKKDGRTTEQRKIKQLEQALSVYQSDAVRGASDSARATEAASEFQRQLMLKDGATETLNARLIETVERHNALYDALLAIVQAESKGLPLPPLANARIALAKAKGREGEWIDWTKEQPL